MYKIVFFIGLLLLPAVAVMAQNADTTAKKITVDKKSRTKRDSAKAVTEKNLQAKRDSVAANPIVPKVKPKTWHPDSNHSPHTAVMHSLMVPGWGQLYNHQVWLIPPIYAGLGLLVNSYISNKSDYRGFLAIAQYREKGQAPAVTDKYYTLYQNYSPYSTQTIDDAVTASNRNTEICIFSFVGVWGIQIIQAYIEAKFQHSYTIDNNLSFKVAPTFINPPVYASNLNGSYIPGLKLTFALR